MEWMENHDVRCDIQHLKMEYLTDHSSCKFPAAAQLKNVPVSILRRGDAARLKKPARIPDREMQSIQNNI